MKQIILDDYQKNGASHVEAFIDSYLELRKSGVTHEAIDKEYAWVEQNPYFDPYDEYSCESKYTIVFLIEDVELWFNKRGGKLDQRGKWTNQDVRNVFDGTCAKKWGNCAPHKPVEIGEIQEYNGIQYVQVQSLFFMCETYLIKTPDDKIFSIWY